MEKCVLIYEDDPDLLGLCKIILSKPGRKVELMDHCENIIADINRFRPNVILMDLSIPTIGGEQAVHLMKGHAGTEDVPVVLFSANSEIEEVCKNLDADGYLKKPFDNAALKAIIEEHIS